MLAKLAEALFVDPLRRYVRELPDQTDGSRERATRLSGRLWRCSTVVRVAPGPWST
jgi:hypothetical protein